jgi:hypothetical protein
LLRSPIGAEPASPRSRHRARHRSRRATLGLTLAATLLAALAAAPPAAATIYKPYYSIERFYLSLVNCTRTGGWVLSDGTCRGYGSGRYSAYVKPLTYSYGISDKVSRPYSKLLAVRNLCSHTANGDPGYRLRRAGYTSWQWGENIGCRDGYASAKAAVLASHLYFQREKSVNGGHWRNIKSTKYRAIGIGVWRYGTRTRLVTDFYG